MSFYLWEGMKNVDTNSAELMNKVKDFIKEEITTISYNTWIKQLEIYEITNTKIIISTATSFQKDFLDGKYFDLISNAFKYFTNSDKSLEIVALDTIKKVQPSTNIVKNNYEYKSTNLKEDYTFETFIVGNNNSFAHAAALAVVESPGKTYNPLFIYGDVGLGKTHLMHSIGNEFLSLNKDAKVLYVTSETFTNEFINTIKEQKMEEFRNKYRNIDILLIDDIQFISGKERVQEEFYHTFNSLRETGSQIVMSSDKPPKDIPLLEARLKSRFEGGLIVDISVPDFETRVAILKKKAEEKNINVDNDILYDIATKIDSNIRELEGVFNKVVAHSSLTLGPITMEMAEKAINTVISQKEKVVSSNYIKEVVANYFNIDKKDFDTSKRSNDIAYPRQIAMYLCREIANLSFKQIGNDFGKRDHTTVMHAYKKIDKDIRENTNTKLVVDSVKKIIFDKI